MKLTGIDGRIYNVPLAAYAVHEDDGRPRSSGHRAARALLATLFPFESVFEEVPVMGCGAALYLDFLAPGQKLAVEVQGAQHRKYVPWFHVTPGGFREQLKRDRLKREWAGLNGIALVTLDDDARDGWAAALTGRPG